MSVLAGCCCDTACDCELTYPVDVCELAGGGTCSPCGTDPSVRINVSPPDCFGTTSVLRGRSTQITKGVVYRVSFNEGVRDCAGKLFKFDRARVRYRCAGQIRNDVFFTTMSFDVAVDDPDSLDIFGECFAQCIVSITGFFKEFVPSLACDDCAFIEGNGSVKITFGVKHPDLNWLQAYASTLTAPPHNPLQVAALFEAAALAPQVIAAGPLEVESDFLTSNFGGRLQQCTAGFATGGAGIRILGRLASGFVYDVGVSLSAGFGFEWDLAVNPGFTGNMGDNPLTHVLSQVTYPAYLRTRLNLRHVVNRWGIIVTDDSVNNGPVLNTGFFANGNLFGPTSLCSPALPAPIQQQGQVNSLNHLCTKMRTYINSLSGTCQSQNNPLPGYDPLTDGQSLSWSAKV